MHFTCGSLQTREHHVQGRIRAKGYFGENCQSYQFSRWCLNWSWFWRKKISQGRETTPTHLRGSLLKHHFCLASRQLFEKREIYFSKLPQAIILIVRWNQTIFYEDSKFIKHLKAQFFFVCESISTSLFYHTSWMVCAPIPGNLDVNGTEFDSTLCPMGFPP